MALRRDTARNLKKALHHEIAFADAVGRELEAGRIKRKEAEKLIIYYHKVRARVDYMISWALRDQGDL